MGTSAGGGRLGRGIAAVVAGGALAAAVARAASPHAARASTPAPRPAPEPAPTPAPAPPSEPRAGEPRHLAPSRSRRGGKRLATAGLALVAVVASGVAVAAARGSGTPEPPGAAGPAEPRAGTAATSPATPTTVPPPPGPAQAFAQAAARLRQVGSFGYRGTVSATDVSVARPARWLAVELTVDGQVVVATARLHEVAVAEDGRAAETVAAGAQVWGRSAASREALAAEGYELIPALSGADPAARGAALLPDWLAAVTAPAAAGTDALGRTAYRGTLPAAVLGPVERERPAVDAEVVVSLDPAGDPARVELTGVAGGPRFHVALDLSRLGAPLTIDAPAA
jgi:hypothetical protein